MAGGGRAGYACGSGILGGQCAVFSLSGAMVCLVGEFEDSFGVGIYVPGKDLIKAGVYKREQTRNTDPSMDDATSYIAVLDRYVLSCFEPICYDFYIAGGNVHQIRESFCAVSVLKNS